MRRSATRTVLLLLAIFSSNLSSRADMTCSLEHAVIDGVTIPYGQELEVVGQGLEPDDMDRNGQQCLEVSRVNGRANQDQISCYLLGGARLSNGDLETLKPGQWYRARGILADGSPWRRLPAIKLVAVKIEAVPPTPAGLADFVDREAEFVGTAAAAGVLQIANLTARLEGVDEWPVGTAGKRVLARGTIRTDGAVWRFERASWHLVELADRVGDEVSLDGRFWTHNFGWWFEYRGTKLYVTDAQDHPVELKQDNHGRRVRVSGKLAQQARPSIEQVRVNSYGELQDYFVVRKARLEFLEPEVTYEQRFRVLHTTPDRKADGVFELQPESDGPHCLIGNETEAEFFRCRNAELIAEILRDPNAHTVDVLARRMADPQVHMTVRLLYAALLAAVNDSRGRTFLIDAVRASDAPCFENAVYCLGEFPFLAPPEAKMNTELAWAEPTLVKLMAEHNQDDGVGPPRAVAFISRIPAVLLKIGTDAARQAVVDVAAKPNDRFFHVLTEACDSDAQFTPAELLRLKGAVNREFQLCDVIAKYLRQKRPDTVQLFLNDIGKGVVYMTFRDRLSQELVAALKAHLQEASAEVRPDVELLILLGEKDPVPALLARLDDPQWPHKNLLVWELAQRKDLRAIAPLTRILREAPRDYFNSKTECDAGFRVENALSAIAGPATPESIRALISLLSVDLSRFDAYIDRNSFRLMIVRDLINITGESYGLDADAWQKAYP